MRIRRDFFVRNWVYGGLYVGLMALLMACSAATAAPTPTPSPAPQATAPAAPANYEGRIVAMGNSLTEGLGVSPDEAWPALLEAKLQAAGHNYEVINAGISGETTSGAVSRADWVLRLEPDIIILETGGNDSLRGVDLDVTEENLAQLVDTFQNKGSVVVLAGMQTLRNLGPDYTSRFASLYPALAQERDLILIPFFLEGVAADPELNQPDGIHPTAEGYEIVLETVYPYVLEAIEDYEAGQ